MIRTATIAATCLLAGGCGSGTRTVSVASTAPDTGPAPAAKAPSAGRAPSRHTPAGAGHVPSASSSAGAAATAGGAPAPPSGSSGSGPAFLNHGGGLSSAEAVVRDHGYAPLDAGQYRSDQTLRVLVGARQGSADNHVQQAFFFADGRYLGTDTSLPSASIRVTAQNDTEVTLSYALYRHGDAVCCPSGGRASVRFQLDNGRLAALDPIPPANTGSAAGRQ